MHQIYHGGRRVQSACVWIFATAYFPLDGWPHCFKRPGSLRLPTCCLGALLLCFDGNYYQYYGAGRYKLLQPADCLLPPITVHCDGIDFLPPWGGNGGSWLTQYKYIMQHQMTSNCRLWSLFCLFVFGAFLLYIFLWNSDVFISLWLFFFYEIPLHPRYLEMLTDSIFMS